MDAQEHVGGVVGGGCQCYDLGVGLEVQESQNRLPPPSPPLEIYTCNILPRSRDQLVSWCSDRLDATTTSHAWDQSPLASGSRRPLSQTLGKDTCPSYIHAMLQDTPKKTNRHRHTQNTTLSVLHHQPLTAPDLDLALGLLVVILVL